MNRILFTAFCLLAGCSIILTAVSVHGAAYWGFSRQMKEEAAAELEMIRAGIETGGPAYLAALPPLASRITVITARGAVLFDNEYDAATMENHADRPEVRAALAEGTGEYTRFSRTLERQTYYRTQRLRDGSVLRIAIRTDSIAASAFALLPLTAAIVLGVAIGALLTASRLTRRIVRPINTLNLETPEDNAVYDELGPLLFRIKAQNDQIAAQMEALRKKQLEVEAVTANMREGLVLLDREGRILSCNTSARTLLHIPAAEPPATPRAERRNALELRRDAPFRLALDTALRGEGAECLLTAESSRLRLMASPVLDGGNVLGAALLLLDVTEQEDRERLRREFSANVSHELKTPLTVISGYAEILSKGLVKPADIADAGGAIHREARRLLCLINDILQLSRLDEGVPELERAPVNLLTLARAVKERALPAAQSRHIRITVEGDEALVTGIPQTLHEMVYNLVDNGIKYNKDHGEVTITVAQEAGRALLCVADTGIGIPPAEQERVFERFYRVDKSRNSGTGGTGLGLSIVKHGAHLHGADLKLESGAEGTRIRLAFPPNAPR
jgi:two-component system phosphate regulon sensor histidine kinase PhoR